MQYIYVIMHELSNLAGVDQAQALDTHQQSGTHIGVHVTAQQIIYS